MTVPFDIEQEPWNVYHLADGTMIKTRTILMGVERREGEFDADGQPSYNVNFHQILKVEAPAELRRLQHEMPQGKQ